MASSEPLDLIVTVVSAKHLKNVNWRNGDLKPYVVLYLDQDQRLSTRSDDSASIKPVWNERITLPLTRSVHESVLNIEVFHSNSNSSDLAKTLVGSVRFPLARLIDSDGSIIPELINSLELVRPSARPQGKIRLKLSIKDRPIPPPQQHPPPPPPPRPQSQPLDYYSAPPNNHYYSPTPPPPPPPPQAPSPQRDYREFSQSPSPSPYQFTDHYYSGYYFPPPPPRSMYDRASNYGLPSGGPSAPADAFSSVDHKQPPFVIPPRYSNYAPPPSGPSAPVDAFPVNDYKPPQAPPAGSRLSSYGVPSGPSAPVDYSPYDHRQLQKTLGGLNLDEERGAADRSESDFAARPNYSYGRDYRREC
ncbi:PREDICTED: formin-like protein 3 [Camelina sativa]|uniref:Formin-like protein 3 n=1 Tax=Camelina sativa TaxID=90675 RepID=A0ABM0XKI7_CAMSA|nr:PREDICTED: formin-like protein 3 [Camelina sativa]